MLKVIIEAYDGSSSKWRWRVVDPEQKSYYGGPVVLEYGLAGTRWGASRQANRYIKRVRKFESRQAKAMEYEVP
jgi:hypothetical protein